MKETYQKLVHTRKRLVESFVEIFTIGNGFNDFTGYRSIQSCTETDLRRINYWVNKSISVDSGGGKLV